MLVVIILSALISNIYCAEEELKISAAERAGRMLGNAARQISESGVNFRSHQFGAQELHGIAGRDGLLPNDRAHIARDGVSMQEAPTIFTDLDESDQNGLIFLAVLFACIIICAVLCCCCGKGRRKNTFPAARPYRNNFTATSNVIVGV